jgi:hypothetical protein
MTTPTDILNLNILNLIEELNPDALKADGFDDCIIGIASRCGQHDLIAYDVNKIIKVLQDRDGMSFEEAQEFFEYNILGAYMGEHTPIFLTTEVY